MDDRGAPHHRDEVDDRNDDDVADPGDQGDHERDREARLLGRCRTVLAPYAGRPGEPARIVDLARAVAARHREPQRHYHTLEHVLEVLAALDLLTDGRLADRPALFLAALLHDVVYDPTSPDNEPRSAAEASVIALDHTGSTAVADEVARLIGLTATHDARAEDVAGCLLLDADLSILGADPARYRRYASDIRAEYTHLDDGAYRAGRTAVLERFLARPAVFATDSARLRWEAPARANLAAELAVLAGPNAPTGPDAPGAGGDGG